LPKYYYKPILSKVQEAYQANAKTDFITKVDIESDVVLVIEADNEELADSARIGFIDIRMWDLYQIEP
jgi:hypothetical protein